MKININIFHFILLFLQAHNSVEMQLNIMLIR